MKPFARNPGAWILIALLAFSVFSHYRTGKQFEEACEAVIDLHGDLSDLELKGGDALVFATRTGQLLNPSNVRRDVWAKVVERAGVPAFDLYSLRHTFATLGRAAGEASFNVARMMGHSRSTLVDQVYAHSLQSGMASVAERVTARALGEQPKLRVIDGKSPDVRRPLDDSTQEGVEERATA